jgi:hypothetical protein
VTDWTLTQLSLLLLLVMTTLELVDVLEIERRWEQGRSRTHGLIIMQAMRLLAQFQRISELLRRETSALRQTILDVGLRTNVIDRTFHFETEGGGSKTTVENSEKKVIDERRKI